MKYLFFDIECCDAVHMCEFGYVLIDEQFNIINRECITINPEHKFRLTGRSNARDITLGFSEEVYFNSPIFPDVYDRIKAILETPDCQIVGFSTRDDNKFLATAWDTYGLPPIPFNYIDFQILYRAYTHDKNLTSIEKISSELCIKDIVLHKSDDDSYAVMRALQCVSNKEGLDIANTLKYLKKVSGNYKAEQAKEHNESLLGKKAQKKYLQNFIRNLEKYPPLRPQIFSGKSICISRQMQKTRFNEYLNLIKALYDGGGIYTGKASECDIFVKYSADDEEDIRLESAKKVIEEGRLIEIVSLAEILTKLNISEETLSQTDYSHNAVSSHQTRKPYTYSTGEIKSTVGDQLKAKGIDLLSIIS